ncbi:uncharacterized protein EV420DRAFT_1574103 [Desarmillaria tabescens]|uniref:Uncharacterized protein n=1 Tax=Armillaria tabescens TaxID=1929756 RepID=A0AA39JNN3_ARMTA|nr:uncharacterized protein EV420DRAFT_1582612 [Desarmillaria tabescens]XP_060325209.1 uncharacterized protein EV420DRAFT_1574103 [Desarmillaria tabescens]KAK0440052.1 hypothetical protein EV420DRAFT_1582612 [Desarmillaria tabescens]KAK0444639.1 hypothetical protein EV420DRAFT_1574103 [Desarmillaria tabescens]
MSQEDGLAPPGFYGTQISDTLPDLPTQDIKLFRQFYGTTQPERYTLDLSDTPSGQELQGELEALKGRLEELMGTIGKVGDASANTLDDGELVALIKDALQLPRKARRVVDPDNSETESDSDSDKLSLSSRVDFLTNPALEKDTKWHMRGLDLYLTLDEQLTTARCVEATAESALVQIQVEQEKLRLKAKACREAIGERRDRCERLYNARMALKKHLMNPDLSR